jgi:cytochrome bd-type quinol oxidase subunit 2
VQSSVEVSRDDFPWLAAAAAVVAALVGLAAVAYPGGLPAAFHAALDVKSFFGVVKTLVGIAGVLAFVWFFATWLVASVVDPDKRWYDRILEPLLILLMLSFLVLVIVAALGTIGVGPAKRWYPH